MLKSTEFPNKTWSSIFLCTRGTSFSYSLKRFLESEDSNKVIIRTIDILLFYAKIAVQALSLSPPINTLFLTQFSPSIVLFTIEFWYNALLETIEFSRATWKNISFFKPIIQSEIRLKKLLCYCWQMYDNVMHIWVITMKPKVLVKVQESVLVFAVFGISIASQQTLDQLRYAFWLTLDQVSTNWKLIILIFS